MVTDYVVGFLYNKHKSLVVLTEKERPAWQKGRLNGIGGHIEPGEVPLAAMQREFKEETGLEVDDWELVVRMTNPSWLVYFYAAYGPILDARTQTDERLEFVSPLYLPPNVLPNLRWLVPLCLDSSEVKKPVRIDDITECTET